MSFTKTTANSSGQAAGLVGFFFLSASPCYLEQWSHTDDYPEERNTCWCIKG